VQQLPNPRRWTWAHRVSRAPVSWNAANPSLHPWPCNLTPSIATIGWYLLDTTDVTEAQLQMAFANNLNNPRAREW